MLPRSLPTPRTPDSMQAPPLRWGILGTGWIARQFAGALHESTRQVIEAVGSRSAEAARRGADQLGARTAHVSYAALVADPRVDIVYVATPHNFHLPHALLAIEAGKHVLIEKPVGLSAAEARTIDEAARAAGVFCMEAMWTLFLPRYDIVRQLLDDGALGEVVTVLADMGETFAPDHRIRRADLAGGPLLDLGTYPTTFATWVLGAPRAVRASGTALPSGVNAQIGAVLDHAGATSVLHFSILGETPTTATIGGTEATIELERPFYRPGAVVLRDDTKELRWDEPHVDHRALHFEAAEVARRISAGETGSPLRPFAETISTLQAMDRIRESVGFDFDEAIAARDESPRARPNS